MKLFKLIQTKVINYKERKFSSWLEFIITLGIIPFNSGGCLITIYGLMPLIYAIVYIIIEVL